jgi:cellulase
MFTKTAIILAVAKLAASHATFQSFVIDGKDAGQHFAVQTPANGNNPIKDVTDSAMSCNGGKATSDFVSVAAGSSVGMQWHHNDPMTENDGEEPIASSHKGPVMVYMAKADTNGEGAVWTKIWEDGFKDGAWGVDRFIDSKGLITVDIPDLEAGEYLIRPELIGLHEANSKGGAQFYNGCGQIKVTGSGSASLPTAGTDMTKAYKADDAGVLYNMYGGDDSSYEIPGPKVWDGASSGSSPAPSKPSATAAPAQSSAAAPAQSSAAAPSPTAAEPVKEADSEDSEDSAPAQPSQTEAASAPSTGNSGSSLPETFTITQFISWLKETTGTSSKARRAHARAFRV